MKLANARTTAAKPERGTGRTVSSLRGDDELLLFFPASVERSPKRLMFKPPNCLSGTTAQSLVVVWDRERDRAVFGRGMGALEREMM